MDDNVRLAKWWLIVAGVALIVAGLLGFVSNPLVGRDGLFATGTVHNVVHLITGALALALAYGYRDVATGAIAFGVLYALVFIVTLFSPDLFGLFEVPVNVADHLLHIALAVVSLGVGWMARSETPAATVR